MTTLRPGALLGLTEEQQRQKVEQHQKLAVQFELAARGQPKTEVAKAAGPFVEKIMHRMPSPMGTQMPVRNTPAQEQREQMAQKVAIQQRMQTQQAHEQESKSVTARKEFSNAIQKRSIEMVKPIGRRR